MTEAQLQEQICNYFSMISVIWEFMYFAPINEGVMMVLKMFKVPDKQCYAIINYLKKLGFLPGVSDLIIGHKGKAYCMELKLPDVEGKKPHEQKASQKIFEKNCKRTGVEYAIVRTMEECQEQMRVWGVVK